MTTYVPAKKNTEYIFYMGLVSRSTGQFQANPTLAAGDFKVSIDGGALANLGTLPAVTPAASKMVKVTIAAAEMNGDNITVVASDAAGAEWDDVIVNIQTSARQVDDLAFPTTSGRSIDVTATGEVGIDWANIGGATTTQNLSGTTVKNATDVLTDTANIKTRIPAALSANGNIKSDIKEIEDQLTSGNNAILKLKQLDIYNPTSGVPLNIRTDNASIYAAVSIVGGFLGGGDGIDISGASAVWMTSAGYEALHIEGAGGDVDGMKVIGAGAGKSINAAQDIAVSDGSLTLAAIADAAWDEALAGHLTAGSTGAALNAAGAAGDPWSTMLPGAYGAGTAGDIIGNNLDAAISTRSTLTAADVWANATRTLSSFGTLVADIWANATRTLSAFGFTVDTNANATETAIKAKTDQLTFTNTGEVDANIQAVNDTELTGDGSTTPWGPA